MSSTPLPDIAKRLHPITTIALRSAAMIIDEFPNFLESDILPGSLFLSIGGTKNTKIPKYVVMEKDVFGQTIHDKYTADENIILLYPQPGDIVAMRLKDNTEIDALDSLVPAGDGCVCAYNAADTGQTDNESAIIGVSLTELNLTGDNQGGINLIPVLII